MFSILAFAIPKNKDAVQSLIYALRTTTPDASPTASIEQHLDAGAFSLDLTKELSVAFDGPHPRHLRPSAETGTTDRCPITDYRPPSGTRGTLRCETLSARSSRVFTPKLFMAHWFIKVVLVPARQGGHRGGTPGDAPCIIVGSRRGSREKAE